MNKQLRKLMALLMIMLMVAVMISTVTLAEEPTDGEDNGNVGASGGGYQSIPPETGNLVIHKYLMPDTAQAGSPNDGTETTPPAGATPLDGITFKLYKVEIASDGIYPAPGALTLDSYTNPTSITDSNNKTFSVTAASVPSVTTGSDGAGTGQATAADLPQGLYLVVEQTHASVSSPTAPFVVAVPMTNPTGAGWLTTVHVYPKNESHSIEKTVNIDSVNIGDEVSYTITPSIPWDIKDANKYDITDQLDPALTYKPNSVTVKAATTKAGLSSGMLLTENAHYTVDDTSNLLTVSFTAVGRTYLSDQSYKFLQIDFVAIVNSNIISNPGYTVENRAAIEFINKAGEDKEVNTETPTELHTGAIKIIKTDSSGTAFLPGARFKIATSEQNAKDGNFLRMDIDNNILDQGDTGYDSATDWVVITDNRGEAFFAGIKDYIVNSGSTVYQEYWLVETQAPNGYNMLSGPVKVTFDSSATEEKYYTMEVKVKNYQGFTLPKTGGTGTLIFTVSGIALVGIAVILIVATKRKKEPTGK